MENPPCRYLEWDSAFFGRRIARVTESRLTAEKLEAINRWCASEEIDCLYYLAEAADSGSVRIADEVGWRFMDIRVTLEKQLKDHRETVEQDTARIRLSREQDIPALRSIARTGFRITRFYNDQNFSRALCDRLYETWIENSCRASGEAVLVAEREAQPVGFVTCSLPEGAAGSIGLIGVREDFHGQGLGAELVEASFRWFLEHGAACVRVVTQGQNLAALRLYQKRGFFTSSVQLWFHKWFRKPGQI